MLTSEYQQLALGFESIDENGATHQQYRVQLVDGNAGMLSTVLPAIRDLLRAAGFDYVVSVAVETDDGRVIFDDEV